MGELQENSEHSEPKFMLFFTIKEFKVFVLFISTSLSLILDLLYPVRVAEVMEFRRLILMHFECQCFTGSFFCTSTIFCQLALVGSTCQVAPVGCQFTVTEEVSGVMLLVSKQVTPPDFGCRHVIQVYMQQQAFFGLATGSCFQCKPSRQADGA